MRGLFFGLLGGLVFPALLAGSGCSSSSGPGSSPGPVTCGPDTVRDGSVCYGVASGAATDDGGVSEGAMPPPPDASEEMTPVADVGAADGPLDASSPDADGGASTPPTFAGVTSVAPASATSLQIAWDRATDRVTLASDIVYDVYVATSAGGENFATPTVTSPPGAASVDVEGLATGSTYYVVVRARNQDSDEDKNTVEMPGVPEADGNPPAFAGASGASPASQGGITVTWEAAIDDMTPTPGIGYYVYVATTAGAEDFDVPSFVTDAGVTTYLVPDLPQPGATYYFVVRAHDAAGNIDSNTVEVSAVPGADTVPPTFGGCTSAVTLNSTEVTVTWDPATDNATPGAAIAYDVYAASTSGQENFRKASGTFTGVAAGLVTGLKPDSTYYFVCRARDLSGNEDANTFERAATTPVDTTPPTFAGVTAVSNVTATSAQLGWTAGTDPQTPTAQIVYDIFQATAAGGEMFSSAPTATSMAGATSITLTGLPPSSTLYWVVRARDLAGNEDTNTIEVTATTGVSFVEDVQPILSQHCAVVGCHVPGNPPEGQVLSAGFAFSNIVNVASREVPSDERVAPGDLAHSYLYQKITAQQSVGSYMPPPSTNDVLMASEIATIKTWILQGALSN